MNHQALDHQTLEQLQQKINQLEKQNRLLGKKLYRSEANRRELENFYDIQSKVVSQTIQGLEQARLEAEQQRQELQEAFHNLQMMQAKLVESEKMSALGVLVAGIAHEINNPINFIHANISHAQAYVKDMLALLELYQDIYPKPDPRIKALVDEKDLEFVTQDINQLLRSMQIGSDRIRNIVLGLRSFSRLDEADYKDADIHDGLESTLMILQHRLKEKLNRPKIDVVKVYGQLPHISCFAGQLNQVFMNILSNAIDAIDEKIQQAPVPAQLQYRGCITIKTNMLEKNWAEIRIADNGIGISDAVQPKVFEPFFTTKPVGRGTGLGMSISYKIIVENHGGRLFLTSRLGEGTELVVQIPVRQD